MKRLLFVISQLNNGGAEQSLLNLLNSLDYKKYSVDLLIFDQFNNETSIIKYINKNVNICSVYKKRSLRERLLTRYITPSDLSSYPYKAIKFIKNKKYDWAFSVGEWSTHDLVAISCNAMHKAIWVHSDLNYKSFNVESFFKYYDFYEKMIFVSRHSLDTSVKNFPFIKRKSIVIHNIFDVKKITSLAERNNVRKKDIPTILTVANFRPEKNHLRQIEIMKILKDRGIHFRWINVGIKSDKALVSKIKSKIKEYKLEKDFIIENYTENPYVYMKRADILTVLSDYESWSNVITEAKILCIPILATKTSGALEQLRNNIDGVLCDFDVDSIADQIEYLLKHNDLRIKISQNLRKFRDEYVVETLREFNDLMESKQICNKDILYLMDIINYNGGAHIATINQINNLKNKKNVSILVGEFPNVITRNKYIGVDFYTCFVSNVYSLNKRRIIDVLTDIRTPIKHKILKFKMYVHTKKYGVTSTFKKFISSTYSEFISLFNIGCVVSEGSNFKNALAYSNVSKKIQWIHTDYLDWINKKINPFAPTNYWEDIKNWEKYDVIVLLSKTIQAKFNARFPKLAKKTVALKNIIDYETIIKKSQIKKNKTCKFITTARLDTGKNFVSIISAFSRIKKLGYNFSYLIIGSGPLSNYLNDQVLAFNLSDEIKILNFTDNPFTYIKKSDVFLLCSFYEGLPNVIYESLILHTPVLATKVGGIENQIKDNYNGWLIDKPNENEIFNKIKFILDNPKTVTTCKNNLSEYKYDNDKIINEIYKIFNVKS